MIVVVLKLYCVCKNPYWTYWVDCNRCDSINGLLLVKKNLPQHVHINQVNSEIPIQRFCKITLFYIYLSLVANNYELQAKKKYCICNIYSLSMVR